MIVVDVHRKIGSKVYFNLSVSVKLIVVDVHRKIWKMFISGLVKSTEC